jgi:hypothetical protein
LAAVSTRRIAHATESGFDRLNEVPARPDNIRTPFYQASEMIETPSPLPRSRVESVAGTVRL